MSHFSTFLFSNPSSAEGCARILDFGNTLNVYNYSPSSEEADYLALWADWCAVGADMQSALDKGKAIVEEQQKKKKAGKAT